MPKVLRRVVVPAVLLAVSVGFATPALAHEQRKVGAFNFTVGWGEEPAYAGTKNSVQLILADSKGKPVSDLGDSLKVEVVFSGATMSLPFEPTFDPDTGLGTPGDYRAWFIPTRPGNYTFHLVGTVHGQKVDQRFTSSETTFDPVKDPAEVQFPAKDPSSGQLSDRITSDEAVTAAIKKAADNGKSKAGTAFILAIVGIALSVVAFGSARARGRSKA
ncbi:MAG: hypothetical protein ACXVQX_10520 [Actinomycetota bacterium]